MEAFLTRIRESASRLDVDVENVHNLLNDFKEKMSKLDRNDVVQVSHARETVSQLMVDISVLLSSILVLKRNITKMVQEKDKYSLAPTKRALFEDWEEVHSTYRNVLYGLRESSQELKDSWTQLNKEA